MMAEIPFTKTTNFTVDAFQCVKYCCDLSSISEPTEHVLASLIEGYKIYGFKPKPYFCLLIPEKLHVTIKKSRIPDAEFMVEMAWLTFNIVHHIFSSVFQDRVIQPSQSLQFCDSMLEPVETADDLIGILLQFCCAFPNQEKILLHKKRLRKSWMGYWDDEIGIHASAFLEISSFIATHSISNEKGSDETSLIGIQSRRCVELIDSVVEFHGRSGTRLTVKFTKRLLNRRDRTDRNPDAPTFWYISLLARIGQIWLSRYADEDKPMAPAIYYGSDRWFRYWDPSASKLMIGRENLPPGIPTCLLVLSDQDQKEQEGTTSPMKRQKIAEKPYFVDDEERSLNREAHLLPAEYLCKINSAIDLFDDLSIHFTRMKACGGNVSRLPIRECSMASAFAKTMLEMIEKDHLCSNGPAASRDTATSPIPVRSPDMEEIRCESQPKPDSQFSQLSLDLSVLSSLPPGFTQDSRSRYDFDMSHSDDESSCSELSANGETPPMVEDDDDSVLSERSEDSKDSVVCVGLKRPGESSHRDDWGALLPYDDSLPGLLPGEWLNGDLIDWWMGRLNAMQQKLYSEETLFIGTGFVTKLTKISNFNGAASGERIQMDYHKVRRFAKIRIKHTGSQTRHDLFDYDRVFFPINVGMEHWVGACADLKNKRIVMLDSMNYNLKVYGRLIRHYLKLEYENSTRPTRFRKKEWKIEYNTTYCPKQANGFDCGVFVCMFADKMGRDEALDFDQTQATDYRGLMLKEASKYKDMLPTK